MKFEKHILVTGANGQVGSELRDLAKSYPQYNFYFTGREELQVENKDAVEKFFREHPVDVCINCAAYTAVDKAEDEKELAMAGNAVAPANLATACKLHNALLIHYSTDYVFNGTSDKPYSSESPLEPVNFYGETKLAGERAVINSGAKFIIIRTSWVYSSYGKNFVKTMIRLMQSKNEINVVNDQIGSPTYAHDLANATLQIVSSSKNLQSGIYHYSNQGIISWFDFANAIRNYMGFDCEVHPIPTSSFPTPAKRPSYSAMDTTAIQQDFGIIIPHWEESLKKCLEILKQ